jgi:2-polyprenyl-6-hydroxyphenyl methylase/3-demethylubiquinone-9 3-methyltransferase
VRFEFGANWSQFLQVLTDERIRRAETSLCERLGVTTLEGQRFLDVGCGSGLFSLAARRLGAEVWSFDFDPLSVACAEELKRRYCPDDARWHVTIGSVLDERFMRELGTFDIVYSWGVLHHTGAMWSAIANACLAVGDNGRLFIAIYNDQGVQSRVWYQIKRIYNRLPALLQRVYMVAFAAALELAAVAVNLVRVTPSRLLVRWTRYENVRGMSRWHDLADWIGGFPFEVAAPDAVIAFCAVRGLRLARLEAVGKRMGCNEFIFICDRRPS